LIQSAAGTWIAFRDSYNTTWLIERDGFITPDAFRQKQLQFAARVAESSIQCPRNRRRYRIPHYGKANGH
jgi:hypothetical protein